MIGEIMLYHHQRYTLAPRVASYPDRIVGVTRFFQIVLLPPVALPRQRAETPHREIPGEGPQTVRQDMT
jgi:hypothetical protein